MKEKEIERLNILKLEENKLYASEKINYICGTIKYRHADIRTNKENQRGYNDGDSRHRIFRT